jgi:hypothetical protein
MAHNENFADENPQHCVDERREHALAVTESVAFEEFDRWMDVALARLVDRWISTAAPRAAQQRFWGRRFEGRK